MVKGELLFGFESRRGQYSSSKAEKGSQGNLGALFVPSGCLATFRDIRSVRQGDLMTRISRAAMSGAQLSIDGDKILVSGPSIDLTIPVEGVELFGIDRAVPGPSDPYDEIPTFDELALVYRIGRSIKRLRIPVIANRPEIQTALDELGRRRPHADLRALTSTVALRKMGMWSFDRRLATAGAVAVAILMLLVIVAIIGKQ